MAVALEFIDLLVRISTIRDKYPGGFEQCLRDHESVLGGAVWHDEHLFRTGAMDPYSMRLEIKHWESMGFQSTEVLDGKRRFKDLCVVESLFGGATLPCDWVVVNREEASAHLAGTEPGPVIGRTRSAP